MCQMIKFLKICLSEIMIQKNETIGRQKIFPIYPYLMLFPYQRALYIFNPQFHFLADQLGHFFTIISYEATQELHIWILLDARHSVIPKTKLTLMDKDLHFLGLRNSPIVVA
jgi:hypothetical protein